MRILLGLVACFDSAFESLELFFSLLLLQLTGCNLLCQDLVAVDQLLSVHKILVKLFLQRAQLFSHLSKAGMGQQAKALGCIGLAPASLCTSALTPPS